MQPSKSEESSLPGEGQVKRSHGAEACRGPACGVTDSKQRGPIRRRQPLASAINQASCARAAIYYYHHYQRARRARTLGIIALFIISWLIAGARVRTFHCQHAHVRLSGGPGLAYQRGRPDALSRSENANSSSRLLPPASFLPARHAQLSNDVV